MRMAEHVGRLRLRLRLRLMWLNSEMRLLGLGLLELGGPLERLLRLGLGGARLGLRVRSGVLDVRGAGCG